MSCTKINIGFGGFGISLLAAFIALLITRDVMVAVSILTIGIVFNLCSVISVIPIIGIIGTYFALVAAWSYLVPALSIPSGILWIVTALFWISLIGGMVITTMVIIFVLIVLSQW